MNDKPVIRLQNTVVRRVVPMTASGCDMLRAIRRHLQDEILEKKGVEVDLPYPTVFHMLCTKYVEMTGIEVVSDSSRQEKD